MFKLVSREEVLELLEYLPLSGTFKWKKCPAYRWKNRKETGSLTKDGYTVIAIKGKKYLAHHLVWLIMTGEWPKDQMDHINHDRNDNRIENLRVVTMQENRRNQRPSKANKSGVMGVYWCKRDNRWRAQIQHNGKVMALGNYKTFQEAVDARKAAEIKYEFHKNHGIAKCSHLR